MEKLQIGVVGVGVMEKASHLTLRVKGILLPYMIFQRKKLMKPLRKTVVKT